MAKRPKERVAVYVGELIDATDEVLSKSALSASEMSEGDTYKAALMNVQIVGESIRAIREHHAEWYHRHTTDDWSEIIETRHQISHHFTALTPQAIIRMISSGQLQRIKDQALSALAKDPS
ncbi:MAG: HepT-like ribonuclease domain-containing protein [Leucobacter sp.]